MQLVRSVRDTGVGTASARFDDTLPFPPAPHRAARAAELDRAGSAEQLGLSPEQLTEASLERARNHQQRGAASHTPVPAALASTAAGGVQRGRLQWRGRELSPEFHEYALRVSRGESLEPFRGRLLADEGPALPWESAQPRPPRRKARLVGALLLLGGVLALVSSSLTSREEASTFQQAALAPMVIAPLHAALQQPALQQPAPQPAVPPEPPLTAPGVEAEPLSSEVSSPPPPSEAIATAPAPAPPAPVPAVIRQPPRKLAAAAPAAQDESSKSVLLVEKPPF